MGTNTPLNKADDEAMFLVEWALTYFRFVFT